MEKSCPRRITLPVLSTLASVCMTLLPESRAVRPSFDHEETGKTALAYALISLFCLDRASQSVHCEHSLLRSSSVDKSQMGIRLCEPPRHSYSEHALTIQMYFGVSHA